MAGTGTKPGEEDTVQPIAGAHRRQHGIVDRVGLQRQPRRRKPPAVLEHTGIPCRERGIRRDPCRHGFERVTRLPPDRARCGAKRCRNTPPRSRPPAAHSRIPHDKRDFARQHAVGERSRADGRSRRPHDGVATEHGAAGQYPVVGAFKQAARRLRRDRPAWLTGRTAGRMPKGSLVRPSRSTDFAAEQPERGMLLELSIASSKNPGITQSSEAAK